MIGSGLIQIRRICFAAVVAYLVAPWLASAQESYPNRPVKILIPYVPGGLPDTVARTVGRKMQELFGAPVVIENRPGGSGGIAATALNAAPVDGYTLLVTEGSIRYNSLLFAKLPYNPESLLPVARLANAPMYLVKTSKLAVASMDEFIAYVKARPGKINYGSAGVGSPHHLSMEALKAGLGLDMMHIAYKGSGEAVPALLGGHIDVLFAAYPTIAGLSKEKNVTLLASNGPHSSPWEPNVPPLAQFIPGYDYASIVGIYARTGTSPEIVQRIAEVAIAATADQAVIRQLFATGIEAAGTGPVEFGIALAGERDRIAKAVAAAHIALQ